MKGQEIKAEERDAIFGESHLGYSIFEETSLKTNSSHWKRYLWRNHPWKPYLWRKLPLKAVFLHSIKTRTRFHGIQVMMPHYQRFGEQEAQLAQQCQHTSLLHQSTRIGRCAVRRESSFIADADRMPVMVLAMRSHLFQRSSAVNLSVTGDIEMISYVREAPVADVVPAASLKIQPPPLRGGGAVDNNQGNGSHDHQIQAFRPSAPATAVATVIITFRISVQVFFFVFELIGILF